jgi:ribonucleoside-diphosphate reductase beta chain
MNTKFNSVYNYKNIKDHTKCNLFLDPENNGVTIARYDVVKYPRLEKLTEKQISFFWRPEEIDVTKDREDFMKLNDHEKHIFTSNLSRQILLDSVQGRSPSQAFGTICTLPELEAWIKVWEFYESIHSRSYSHLIRNVYSNPSLVFDQINNINEIIDCAKDISQYYDSLIYYNQAVSIHGYKNGFNPQTHKKHLWMALMSVNILEGIRFYVSFACSWAFAEQKKMEGNAKIIKFICRDENVHLGATQFLLAQLPKDDTDFIKIAEETEADCVQMFVDTVEQEKQWAKYLFKDGSMIGLTEELVCQYIEWICCKRMLAIGLKCPYKVGQSNPLPWTQGWISGKERQVANQEVENTQYLTGEIDKNIEAGFFKDLKI